MIDVKVLQHLPIPEIIKTLGAKPPRGQATGDLKQLGIDLNVSIVPHNFDMLEVKPLCVFMTNDEERSCIFYRTDLAENQRFRVDRIAITKAFAKYIITGANKFMITESTYFSPREKQFMYEFLMPEEEVHDVIRQLLMPTVLSLANVFSVEPNFVVERLDAMKGTLKSMVAGYDF